jgi:hypothetical protein
MSRISSSYRTFYTADGDNILTAMSAFYFFRCPFGLRIGAVVNVA